MIYNPTSYTFNEPAIIARIEQELSIIDTTGTTIEMRVVKKHLNYFEVEIELIPERGNGHTVTIELYSSYNNAKVGQLIRLAAITIDAHLLAYDRKAWPVTVFGNQEHEK